MRQSWALPLLLLPAYGQQPESIPETKIKVEVRRVPVDVIVTDAKGNPIGDLKKEDFTVLEDKKPQEITSFSLERVSHQPQVPIVAPQGFVTNASTISPTTSDLTVILFDELNTSFSDAAYARYRMEKLLQEPSLKGHPTALLVLNRDLVRLHDFTDEPQQLLVAFKQHEPFLPSLVEDESASVTPGIERGPAGARVADAQRYQQAFGRLSVIDRTDTTLGSLAAIARSLRDRPGRKKLIWFSAGFPVVLSDYQTQRGAFFGAPDARAMKAIGDASLALTDARVSVYPIDVRGLNAPRYYSPSSRRTGDDPVVFDNRTAMETIADQTGGTFYRNRNYFEQPALHIVSNDNEYYALTYRPTEKADGKFRKIEVKVKRPALRIRYRQGYFAPQENPAQPAPPALEAAVDPLQRNELQFAAAGMRVSDHAARFIIVIDAVALGLARRPNATSTMEILLAEDLGANQILLSEPRLLDVHLDPLVKDSTEHRYSFAMTLPTRSRSNRVRLLLRDTATGQIGSLDLPLQKPTS